MAPLTQAQVLQTLMMASILGLIPGYIAYRKGRSFVFWWIYGAMIFIVALVHSLLIKPLVKQPEAPLPMPSPEIVKPSIPEGIKMCHACGQLMDSQAARCPVCKEPQPVPGV